MLKQHLGYLLFLICMVTPSFISSLGAPSMAYGLILVALVFILVASIKVPIFILFQDMRKIIFIMIGLLVSILIHGLSVLVLMYGSPFDGKRFLLSTICLLVVFTSIVFFLYYVKKIEARYFEGAINFVFIALVLMLILGISGYLPSLGHSKNMVFFGEPSHLSLVLAPFMLYVVSKATLKRIFFILLLVFNLALVIQNVTLMCLVVLACFFVRLSSRLVIFLLLVLSFYATPIVTRQINLAIYSSNITQDGQHFVGYVADRLPKFSQSNGGNFDLINSAVKNSSNGSLLAFISGWQRAYLNLIDSKGLGFGFQQFGVNGRWGSATNKLKDIYGYSLCLLDGGSVAPKFAGEFGVIGVILLMVYMILFSKFVLGVIISNRAFLDKVDFRDAFFICCFVSYSISVYLRGVGYFSIDSFLFLASVFWFLQPEKSMRFINILNKKVL